VVADKLLSAQPGETFGGAQRYWNSKHSKEATLEFDRARKRMSVIVSAGVKTTSSGRPTRSSLARAGGGNSLLVKGQVRSRRLALFPPLHPELCVAREAGTLRI
jgi:hypothetical protein